jgi:hypothetical protein
MRTFLQRHKILMSVIGIIAILFAASQAWSLSAKQRGYWAARLDLRRGQYILLAYGLPWPWRPEYAKLFRERYGIEVRAVALCIVSETLRSYVDSYDEVIASATNQRFGHDVFKECAEAASKNWELQKAAKLLK